MSTCMQRCHGGTAPVQGCTPILKVSSLAFVHLEPHICVRAVTQLTKNSATINLTSIAAHGCMALLQQHSWRPGLVSACFSIAADLSSRPLPRHCLSAQGHYP